MHTLLRAGVALGMTVMVGWSAPTPAAQAYGPASEPIAGWICTAGQRRWLQFSPCPATYMRVSSVDMEGTTDSGEHMTGSGTVSTPTPVQQQPLTADQVCDALGDPSVRIPHHGSSDVYERNILKSKYCGL